MTVLINANYTRFSMPGKYDNCLAVYRLSLMEYRTRQNASIKSLPTADSGD